MGHDKLHVCDSRTSELRVQEMWSGKRSVVPRDKLFFLGTETITSYNESINYSGYIFNGMGALCPSYVAN